MDYIKDEGWLSPEFGCEKIGNLVEAGLFGFYKSHLFRIAF